MKKLYIITFQFLFCGLFTSLYGQNIDSLLNIANNSPADSLKVKAYTELADFYYYDNPDTAMFYYNKSINMATNAGFYEDVFYAQSNLFNLLLDESDFFNAKQVAIDGILNAEKSGDSSLISQAHSNMGNLYMYIEMNEKALTHFLNAVNVYPIEKNPAEAGKLFGRLGNLYLMMDDLDKAQESYLKAIDYFKAGDVKKGVIIATQNLGVIQKRKGNYENAIDLFSLAQRDYKAIGSETGVAQCMANIGNIYIETNQYYKALDNLHKAIIIFKKNKMIIDEIIAYSELSDLYLKIKKPDLALDYILKANELLIEIPENLSSKLAVLHQLQKVYEASGKINLAYKYLHEYKVLNDSIVLQDSQRRLDILKTQFEFDQKEKDIKLLTVENELKENELKRKNIFQLFYLVIIGLAAFAILALMFLFRLKKKANVALELKNAEIMQQKEEIEAQRDEIEAQRDTVYSQKLDLETIHLKISQSIEYAQLIQASTLPNPLLLKDKVAEHFVVFKPKDIVSGDFYWWANVENHTIITAVDCTGHGVPGAFMSMLGISFLREIVMKEYITHPGVILRKLRKEIVRSLNQKDELGAPRDGMDMALISINHENLKVQFAGAHNSVYIISKSLEKPAGDEFQQFSIEGVEEKLIEIKPDKMPIAIYHRMDPFTNHEIQLQKGDQIYMFSDGFVDQFGGENKKRFMNGAFRELLLKIASHPMDQQKEILENTFDFWKGDYDQIDDVVIVGIKI
ncbi:MAG: SpoIIE family protein phosphatase [Bacteroidales bacterium]|jgi:serine phosphatase RsbU (regulator of sigma subunit)|nr:SpoIIE family protein phosphatase [Bacteroidales bacterium]